MRRIGSFFFTTEGVVRWNMESALWTGIGWVVKWADFEQQHRLLALSTGNSFYVAYLRMQDGK